MKYDDLTEKLASEYEDSLVLQYKDKDGDFITVRSQSDLDIMIGDRPSNMKLYLTRTLNSTGFVVFIYLFLSFSNFFLFAFD